MKCQSAGLEAEEQEIYLVLTMHREGSQRTTLQDTHFYMLYLKSAKGAGFMYGFPSIKGHIYFFVSYTIFIWVIIYSWKEQK